jgi:hypothetical protein
MGFVAPSPCAAASRTGPVIPCGLPPCGAQTCTRERHRHSREMPHRGDRLCRLLCLGQHQRVRPAPRAGWGMALRDEGLQPPTLLVTQWHDILLGPGGLLSQGSVPKTTDKQKESL